MQIPVNDKVRIGRTRHYVWVQRGLVRVRLVGTCVELSRYRVLGAMGIGNGIVGKESAAGQ